jgi:hypothetical protein
MRTAAVGDRWGRPFCRSQVVGDDDATVGVSVGSRDRPLGLAQVVFKGRARKIRVSVM